MAMIKNPLNVGIVVKRVTIREIVKHRGNKSIVTINEVGVL